MITSTPFRPKLVLPEVYQYLLSPQDHKRFQVTTYNSSAQAWSIVEDRGVDVFVSVQSADTDMIEPIIPGVLALKPEVAHVHVFHSTQGLVDLINLSSLTRLILSSEVQSKLAPVCSHVFELLQSQKATLLELMQLREANEQYEFMLRQTLLS